MYAHVWTHLTYLIHIHIQTYSYIHMYTFVIICTYEQFSFYSISIFLPDISCTGTALSSHLPLPSGRPLPTWGQPHQSLSIGPSTGHEWPISQWIPTVTWKVNILSVSVRQHICVHPPGSSMLMLQPWLHRRQKCSVDADFVEAGTLSICSSAVTTS